ncbi:unnamed protein product [Cercospora beticola]|nr:unnamed protein product [Cercospora beticola]
MADIQPSSGDLNWRLSAHPITLVTFLAFRICTPYQSPSPQLSHPLTNSFLCIASLLVYLLGMIFTTNFVMIFIITIILLAMDFYYLKNIAGRRLVGLRWWNEVNTNTGESHWVFESAPQANEPGGKIVNATDKRFFWLALYAQPGLWVALAIVAFVKLAFVWLTLVGEYILAERRLGRGGVLTVWGCSYCAGSYDHEYVGFLKMRQVQSGEWAGGERIVHWVTGAQCGRSDVFEVDQSRVSWGREYFM